MEAKKLIAEVIGTFTLVFAVLLASNTPAFPVPVPIIAGLVVGLFVYSIGHISGCHLNPAVTLSLVSIRKIKPVESVQYIIAQVIGAVLALAAVSSIGIQVETAMGLNDPMVLIGEIVGTAILTFGIAAVVFGKVTSGASGAVIGASLSLGAFLAVLIGAPGFLNPAVALGALSLTPFTLIGPILGGMIGMLLYKFLDASK